MNHTILLEKEIEVLIVSAGGVGTTFLLKAIGKHKTTNHISNFDGFKHITIPPITRNRNLKVIYVFGNPITATMSLFRRNFHHTQSYKMQQYLPQGYRVAMETSLEGYAKKGVDGFYFRRHFDNWAERYLVYPTLFLKYETLFDNVDEIATFLNLPQKFIADFPAKKTRNSQVDNLDKTTLTDLKKMYGRLETNFEELPDFFVKDGKALKSFSVLFDVPYYIGAKKLFWKKMPFLRRVRNRILGKKIGT